jgi:hypothetical protein
MHRVTTDDEFKLLVGQYDAEAGAKISIQRSGGMVDDLLAHGASVLGALGDQKDRLKGAQHKMLDLLNTIGVSASLLRVIDRRCAYRKVQQFYFLFNFKHISQFPTMMTCVQATHGCYSGVRRNGIHRRVTFFYVDLVRQRGQARRRP